MRLAIFILLLVTSISKVGYADLPYKPLKFELLAAKHEYTEGDILKFTLRITNTDKEKTYPVMVPGSYNSGKKLIHLAAYTIDSNNHYTEVAKEYVADVPGPSGATSGNAIVKQLAPGKHIDIDIRFHPKLNYATDPKDRHWFSEPLPPGTYQFLAWYDPYGIVTFDLYEYADQYKDLPSTDKLVINKGGESSSYCEVVIKKDLNVKTGMTKCIPNCKFCDHIKKGRWNSVRNDIEQTTRLVKEQQIRSQHIGDEINWLTNHKYVVYLSDPPEAILSSLPSYWSQAVGFRSGADTVYYDMTFQIGKVYSKRARLQTITYWLFPRWQLFNTSTIDYVGLVRFKEREQK